MLAAAASMDFSDYRYFSGTIGGMLSKPPSHGYLVVSDWILFVLRFNGPVNPLGSFWVWSVYLATPFTGRRSPQSVLIHILLPEIDHCPSWISRREKMMIVENISWSISTKECCGTWWRWNHDQQTGENDDRRKYFIINFHERMLWDLVEINHDLLTTCQMHIQVSQQGLFLTGKQKKKTKKKHSKKTKQFVQLFVGRYENRK